MKENDHIKHIEVGKGPPIVVLYGLMGGLSNFKGVLDFFPKKGYRVIVPDLPLYSMPIKQTTVKSLANYLYEFVTSKNLENIILLGNSLGGHISLLFSKFYPEKVKGIVITGSSGLYENTLGGSFPKRGNYEFVKEKVAVTFYDPKHATKELVDECFDIVNDKGKTVRIISLAKSAIRHNMASEIPKMNIPTCLIWGKNDTITPPDVAEEFHDLFPDSDLFWVDECGHAAMMEHPEEFNKLLDDWLNKRFNSAA